MRKSDKERVFDISSKIWEGDDYVPSIFENWINDMSYAKLGFFDLTPAFAKAATRRQVNPLLKGEEDKILLLLARSP